MRLSRIYMKGSEFKKRQAWLAFTDATGIALQCVSDTLYEAREWLRKFTAKYHVNNVVNRSKWLWPELIGIQQTFYIE